MDGAVPHLYVSAERARFGGPVAAALLLNAALVFCGFLSRHDNLLDLLKAGEVQAIAQPPPPEEQQVQLELDPVPPPPPVDDPAFVLPVEAEKPPEPDVPPPPDEPEPEPPPVAQEPPPPEPPPPAPPVEIPPPPAPTPVAVVAPEPAPAPPAPAPVILEQPSFHAGDPSLPKPLYPMQAKLRRQQGTVLLAITLAAGRVAAVAVAQSSGYGVLDTSARKWAEERWTFPAQYSGEYKVPVTYQLDTP